ncbi:MAG: hypothetical protein AAF484_08170 [Pseudomonadota bacterium]
MFRLKLFGPFMLTDSVGAEVPLASRKARALLAYLARSPGKQRSREEILALLWSDREDAQGRASLRQVLTGLRKEVDSNLLLIDRDSVALNADLVEINPASDDAFLAGFSLRDPAFEDWLRDERLRLAGVSKEQASSPRSEDNTPFIAVLPFQNLSNDPDQAFFSDGITEDIVTELSRFDDMIVISPRASFQFRDKSVSVRDIGTELGAHYIVEGSVRQAADRVRISASLTETETGAQLWAERFDRKLTNVFELQEDVALRVAATVTGRIFDHSYVIANRRPPTDLTAYQHLLKGEWIGWHQYGSPKALECFEKAVEIDPDFARAHALLANWHAYSVFAPLTPFGPTQSRVREFAERAMDLDPYNVVNMMWVSGAYLYIGDHELARTLLEKAIRTNPNHFLVMLYAAMIYAWQGETQKSQDWLDHYSKVSSKHFPSDSEIFFEVYYLSGRFEEAIAAMSFYPDKVPEIAAELAAAHAQIGRMKEAEALRRKFEETMPTGYTFDAHAEAILRCCAREKERDLWRDGYRKAGFI